QRHPDLQPRPDRRPDDHRPGQGRHHRRIRRDLPAQPEQRHRRGRCGRPGRGTILDDDAPPALSIGDVAVTEGDSGTTDATFTVSLSAASGKTVTVDYATADGSAAAGDDYTAASGTLTFAPGETSKTVTVSVIGDRIDEDDETFVVNLSGA